MDLGRLNGRFKNARTVTARIPLCTLWLEVSHTRTRCVWTHTEHEKKKMIILQKETTEHREPGDISPRGEPWPPPSVLTPQSPCTIERAVGVGTLYQDTIYASAATTNVTTPFCTGRGGSSIPSGRGRVLVRGAPALHRAMLERQARWGEGSRPWAPLRPTPFTGGSSRLRLAADAVLVGFYGLKLGLGSLDLRDESRREVELASRLDDEDVVVFVSFFFRDLARQ